MRLRTLLLTAVMSGCSAEGFDELLPADMVAERVDGLRELSHTAAVRFERSEAFFEVERHFRNDSETLLTTELDLELPDTGVASGLWVAVDGQWRPAQYLDTSVAEDSWLALTAPGDGAPHSLAMLTQGSIASSPTLQLFAVPPGAEIGIRYRVRARADWIEGHYEVGYPVRESPAVRPTITLPFAAGARVVDDETLTIVSGEPRIDVLDGRLGHFTVGPDRTVWRLELDVAQHLSEVPQHPFVVFTIDASHSEGEEGIAAQLELIPAYLASVPDAEVELVVYRRDAERVFGHFVPAAEALTRLKTLQLAAGNGSNIDRAVALAAQLLPASGVTRLVAMTDFRFKDTLTADAFADAASGLPRDTVMHVIARSASSSSSLTETPVDGHAFEPVVAAHGGVMLDLYGHEADPSSAARAVLPLVRPVRLDAFEIVSPDLEAADLEHTSVMGEGDTVQLMAIAARPARTVTVRGKLWAKTIERTLVLDDDFSARVPAFALGDSTVGGTLEDAEVRTAAVAIQALSPQTSFLWAPDEAAASTAGEADLGAVGLYGGCLCGGSESHCGGGFGLRGPPPPDRTAELRAMFAPLLAQCGLSHALVKIETTDDEIVEVRVESSQCLEEAVWAVRLPKNFVSHRHFTVAVY